MSNLVRKLKKVISDKINSDGSGSNQQNLPLEYDADELREALKNFQENPLENAPATPKPDTLWESIGSANRLVQEQMKRDDKIDQYWMGQIREVMDKLEAAEDSGDIRKIEQYLGLLNEFAIRTRNTALEQFVKDKQRDILLQIE
jgi:hypothetical protein